MELKGSKLSPKQVAIVVDLLAKHGAKFFVTGIVMSGLTPEIVDLGKKTQAARLTDSLTPQHQPTLVQQLHGIRAKMEAMSAPQFVQFILLRKVIENVIRYSLNHFSFHGPRELGRFLWKADAKNEGRSAYEVCWSKLGPGLLQSAFLARPILVLRGGDYSDHNAVFLHESQEWPDYLPRTRRSGTGRTMDLGAMLRDSFAFADSRDSVGIQLADVITNSFRRAVVGNLHHDGWKRLGQLILRFEERAVDLVHLPLPKNQQPVDLPSDFRVRLDEIDAQALVMPSPEWAEPFLGKQR